MEVHDQPPAVKLASMAATATACELGGPRLATHHACARAMQAMAMGRAALATEMQHQRQLHCHHSRRWRHYYQEAARH